ncbi:hypothetical protein [Winogradskya consettensis]|uniref:hypothetical protein n=1 Tax=Winogradskya consettensis TaxID=113560 RepID=UPI001BB3CB23|nr:hypothetical protein [Actinoplanes consettensis]
MAIDLCNESGEYLPAKDAVLFREITTGCPYVFGVPLIVLRESVPRFRSMNS